MDYDEEFDWFDQNKDVTSDTEKAYMDALNKITDSRNNVYQFLMGQEQYQGLGKDDKD